MVLRGYGLKLTFAVMKNISVCIVDDNRDLRNALEEIIEMNREAVVQDWSSQRVGNLIKEVIELESRENNEFKVWDCYLVNKLF